MNLRNFRIGWRLLVKEPAYSAVVILGLSVGFAACFLLLGYVRHSLSYDQQVPERGSVYRIMQRWNVSAFGSQWQDATSLKAREAAVASGQPVLATLFFDRDVDVRAGERVQSVGMVMVDPEFEKIFEPKVLSGDLHATLTRPDALALSVNGAIKLFGSANAVGQVVQAGGQAYKVGAVVADQPAASTMPFEALAGSATTLWPLEDRKLIESNWGSSRGRVYVKLLPGADRQALLDAIQRGLADSPTVKRMSADQVAALGGKNVIDFKLGSLADAYLDPDIQNNSDVHGDRQTIYGLAAVAVLILLLAATNYVNLATVRTVRRQREIAVRKVLGAPAPAVVRQFLAESVLVCLIAAFFGLLLAWLVLPVFSDLVQRRFDSMFSPGAIAAAVVMGALLGVAAGAYPTWSALGVRPTAALSGRGNVETASGLWLRRVLTVLQFATAMALTGTTLAVAWQTHYASTLNPGYDPDPLLVLRTNKDMRDANVRAFRDALARVPGVQGVAESDMPMTVSFNSTTLSREGGAPAEVNVYLVSPGFYDVYHVAPLAGRMYNAAMDHMTDADRMIINASAAAKFGFASPQDAIGKMVGSPMGYEKPMQVIGVMPDLRHRSARDAVQPSVFYLGERMNTFTVRVNGDMAAVQSAVETMWPRFFPNDLLDARRMSTMIGARYANDLRLAKLLAASSVIAIAIAAFGIYVLAAYSVQRKTKEIVLRKLYGAGHAAIGGLVMREFAMLTGIGALIGLPAAWIATERYLAPFTERAPIGMWAITAALLVAGAVALFATLRHTLSAIRIMPALALRD